MMRFMVFDAPQYYPGGGMSDFRGDFATLEEAMAIVKPEHLVEWQILDLRTHRLIRLDDERISYDYVGSDKTDSFEVRTQILDDMNARYAAVKEGTKA